MPLITKPIVKIRRAFEKAIQGITPSIPTAWQNAPFDPVVDQAYQRVLLIYRNPDNTVLGDEYYREQGECNIFLSYPDKQGMLQVEERAELIRSVFPRGSTLTEQDLQVKLLRTPGIQNGGVIGDRQIVLVSIPFIAEVLNV